MVFKYYRLIFIFLSFCLSNDNWQSSKIYKSKNKIYSYQTVLTGIDVLELNNFDLLVDKTIGIVANHTSINRFDRNLADLLRIYSNINNPIIFTPEHGFKGNLSAGYLINKEDRYFNARVVSLYGKNKKPNNNDLKDIDLLVFDLQDVGARYYTYVSTLTFVMQAAADNGIPIIVLDRPNPLRGDIIQGPLLQDDFKSFVGMHPIPIRHGMTIGELAIMINENGWLGEERKVDLTIVPVVGWERAMWYDETGKYWRPPSPNLGALNTAIAYLGTCLVEGTNVSEGRGTSDPFLKIGAPWIDPIDFNEKLNYLDLPGVVFFPDIFTPISIPGKSKYPKYENQRCYGTYINIVNREEYNPILTGVGILLTLKELYPNDFKWDDNLFIDKLFGSEYLRSFIGQERNILSFDPIWEKDQFNFYDFRKSYLIYYK